ncbi:MAG: hypothetical protein NTX73_07425 [Rhodobacterales bacterium]|nr:hypothetical protein [Rhodobacterales bacterium]
MRGNVLALLLATLSEQAVAQSGPRVDLELVMAAHADQVTTITAADGTWRERLGLGEGVVILHALVEMLVGPTLIATALLAPSLVTEDQGFFVASGIAICAVWLLSDYASATQSAPRQ